MTEMTESNVWQLFLDLAAQGKGISAIAHLLAEIVGREAVICDVHLNSLTGFIAGDASVEQPEGFIAGDAVGRLLSDGEFFYGDIECGKAPRSCLMKPIGDSLLYGYCFILDSGQERERFKEPLRAAALGALAELSRMKRERDIERKYHNDFIQDILYNNLPNREAIYDKAGIWGWDLAKPHSVVIVGADPGELPERANLPVERMYHWSREYVRENNSQTIIADRNSQIILLVPQEIPDKGSYKHRLQPWVTGLCQYISKHTDDYSFSAGIGRLYPGVTDLYRAYQEAKIALDIHRLLKRKASISFFDELGVLRLVYNQGEQELKEYCQETLGLLEEYDRIYGADLLQTLIAFIYTSADFGKTAEALFVHVNTLRYRLKKIEEITGKDLKNLSVLANFHVALQIKTMLSNMDRGD
ncbi:PucR family transcriptional regulator [Acetonema longum]|uniref:CdaR family transcriptional regulator n=1 Tax=Acetonema longum DSM 6540 TaxID=1009370 RepID=F7NJR6_9FIRM|nr:helix-turn-helix domain-containing protein [Acetonema longum]EGO63722.1 CdaR family transcriptional regulator [Acetonema longum DSM 6540]